MKFGPIEIDRKYHCCEESTGNNLTGIFHVSKDEIILRLVSYKGMFHVDFHEPIVIRTEGNWIVSLHENIPVSGYNNGTVHSFELFSNMALIGRNAWRTEDLIRQVAFRIPHSEDSLYHSGKYDSIANAEIDVHTDRTVFSLYTVNMRIFAYYAASFQIDLKHPTKIVPKFSIEFDFGIDIFHYRNRVQCIVRFFSALTGSPLRASDISIFRHSEEERKALLETKAYSDKHSVWEPHSKNHGETPEELWVGHQFAHSSTDEELFALVACLQKWVERDAEWEAPTHLMLQCMLLHREISSNRLMAACKWFEAIPGTQPIVAMKPEDVEAVAKEASTKAVALGYADIVKRISGSIKRISKEGRIAQYERLVDEVQVVFGKEFLDRKFVYFLVEANNFRGKIAHGYFEPEGRSAFLKFSKAVYALECLCYLLTIKDLPMADGAKNRVKGIPMIDNYFRCAVE
jgi:hypothetical protein